MTERLIIINNHFEWGDDKIVNFQNISRVVFAVGRQKPEGVQLLGIAFALNKPGVFATASHVVGMDDQGLVLAFKNLSQVNDYQDTSDKAVHSFPVKIIAPDPFHGLVVLKADNDIISNITISGADQSSVGNGISIFGFPHAGDGRMVLTQQDTEIGARILISSGGIKAKHLVLNIQTRPGQSGSPVFRRSDGILVGVLIGSYAPGGGGGMLLGGIDPHTLHQTTHAVSSEYLAGMY